jgi:hypothetical protein
MDSILDSIKKPLGLPLDDDAFDTDVIMHINSIFFNLNQLGVGPTDCFSIQDKTSLWSDFLGDAKNLEAVKTYIYLKVRLLFDPPTSSFVVDSITKQITEYEWRLNVQVEKASPVVVPERYSDYES